MVNQYPDTITITVTAAAVKDEVTGNHTPGTSIITTYQCRAETNSSGGKIVGADGAVYDYSFMVYMPQTEDIIPQDSEYSLSKGGAIYVGKVKNASNGQMNSRLWL